MNMATNNPSQVYDLAQFPHPGKLLILSQYEFEHDPNKMRFGTHADVNSLSITFNALRLDVDCCSDYTYNKIKEKIHHYARVENYEDCGCLIVAILTHGGDKGLLWAKDKTFHISKIWQPFVDCERLKDKPKIFLIQACRTDTANTSEARFEVETDAGSSRDNSVLPHASNFLLAYSTTEGLPSYRSKEQGSWYIQTLCDSLRNFENGKSDLLSILTDVNHDVTRNFFPYLAQTPEFTSYMQYKIILSSAAVSSFQPLSSRFQNPSTSQDSGEQQQSSSLENIQANPNVEVDGPGAISRNYRLPCSSPGATIIFYNEGYATLAQLFVNAFAALNLSVCMQTLKNDRAYEIEDELKEYVTTVPKAASIFVVILATIGEDCVIEPYTTFKLLTDVLSGRNCKEFRGKPKIFLFLDPQNCNVETDSIIGNTGRKKVSFSNNHSDFLRYFGYGHGSVRRLLLEISSLKDSRDDLMHVMTRSLVQSRRDHRDYMSHLQSSLTKYVLLGPLQEGEEEEEDEEEPEVENPPLVPPEEAKELENLSLKARELAERSRYDQALKMYENIIEKYNKIFGPDHLYTLSNLHNFAFTLGQAGMHQRSIVMYEHVIDRRTQVLGAHHVHTLNTMHNKAWVLQQMGLIDSAKNLYNHVLQLQMDTLGPLHRDTRRTEKNLSALSNEVHSCIIV